MKILVALAAVGGLFLVGLLGGMAGMGWIFGIVIPSLALLLFVGGLVAKVWGWSKSPVPFRIPTTCGQQKSLDWLPHSRLENPQTSLQVVGRMALEVLFFRSLLRNTKAELVEGRRLVYRTELTLWLGGMLMHTSGRSLLETIAESEVRQSIFLTLACSVGATLLLAIPGTSRAKSSMNSAGLWEMRVRFE